MVKKINREVVYKMSEISMKIENKEIRFEILSAIEYFISQGKVICTNNTISGYTKNKDDYFEVELTDNKVSYSRKLPKLGEENKKIIRFIDEDLIEIEISKSHSIMKNNELIKLHKNLEINKYCKEQIISQEIITNDFSPASKDYTENMTSQSITYAYGDGAINACHKVYQGYPHGSYTGYYLTNYWPLNKEKSNKKEIDNSCSMTGISKEEYHELLNLIMNNKQKVLKK